MIGAREGGVPSPGPFVPCPNCGGPHVEAYCSRCGQRRPEEKDYDLGAVLRAAVERTLQYDGRLLGSLKALFVHPGLLTREHFDGRRGRYVPPFQLFVMANVVVWLLFPRLKLVGFDLKFAQRISIFHDLWNRLFAWREAMSGLSHEQFLARAAAQVGSTNEAAVLWLTPLFAFATATIVARRGYRFVQHLVFSVHFFCIHLASVLVAWGALLGPSLRYMRAHPEWATGQHVLAVLTNPWLQHLTVAPFLGPYLYVALRRAYGLSPREGSWRAVLLTAWAVCLGRGFLDMGYALILLFT